MKKPQDPLFYGIPEAVSEPEMGLRRVPLTRNFSHFTALLAVCKVTYDQ